MTLRAVFFDIDDTLFPTSVFAQRARRQAVEAMVQSGLDVDVEVAFKELQQVVEEFSSNYDQHFDQLVTRLGRHLRDGVHPAIVIASGVWAYHATKEHIRAYPDALRILDALRRTTLKRGIISNGRTVKQAEKLVRLGIQNAFSRGAIFISEEIGVAKPHPKIFLIACESLGVQPSDALYVGDSRAKDIDPAHEAGLVTCLRAGEGRYGEEPGRYEPDHLVERLDELVPILEEHYGIEIDRSA